MIDLRHYQENNVSQIRKSFQSGKRAPLYVAPTGSGKTVVFTFIGSQTAKKGNRVLILTHRIELVRQTAGAFRDVSVEIGIINPQYTPDYHNPIQVASIQTLIRRLHLLPAPDLIIIDECHHATSDTYRKIVAAYPGARILGVTATPVRTDGKGLGVLAGGLFDDLIIGPSMKELIEWDYLSKFRYLCPSNKVDLSDVSIKMGDFDKAEINNIMDTPTITGDAVEHYIQHGKGRPTLAFCVSRKHAEHLAETYRSAGIKSVAVDGKTAPEERQKRIYGLEDGSVEVLTSCDLIGEGIDVPAVAIAQLLRPTHSMGLFLQQIGRVMRPAPGKEEALILDHVGNVFRHDLPDAIRIWSLNGRKKKPRKGADDGENTKIKQCDQCFAVHEPAPQCPLCGYVYPIVSRERELEQVDGQLQEITPEDLAKKKQRQEQGRADSFEKLLAIERQRGYKSGWARIVWNSKRNKKKAHVR